MSKDVLNTVVTKINYVSTKMLNIIIESGMENHFGKMSKISVVNDKNLSL